MAVPPWNAWIQAAAALRRCRAVGHAEPRPAVRCRIIRPDSGLVASNPGDAHTAPALRPWLRIQPSPMRARWQHLKLYRAKLKNSAQLAGPYDFNGLGCAEYTCETI